MANGFNFSDDGKTLLNCDFSQLEKNVILPDGTQKIANGVFAESPVENVILPDSVTELGENVFSSSKNLQSVTLSKNIKNLKPFTFSDCTSLKKIKLPDNLESLSEGLFFGCTSLEEFDFGQNQNNFSTLERDFFASCESLKDLTLPSNITEIKKGALSGCSSIKTLCIPSTLKNIEDRSLAGLSSLEEILFSYDFSLENSESSNPNEIIFDDSSLNKYNQHFFIDKNSQSLYQKTDDGFILIKSPANTTSIKLLKNTYDIHIDALDDCTALEEIFVHEETNPDFVEKLLEQFSSIDINSFSDEVEAEIENKLETEIPNDSIEQENHIELDSENKNENTLNKNDESGKTQKDFSVDIDSILNDQCCRNDALDEGFRPVSFDELEALMNPQSVNETKNETSLENKNKNENDLAQEDSSANSTKKTKPKNEKTQTKKSRSKKTEPDETKKSQTKTKSKSTKKQKNENSKLDNEETAKEISEDVLKEFSEKNENEKIEFKEDVINSQSPSINKDEIAEHRFIRALKSISHHQLILEEKENKKENVFGELTELFVFADNIAPSTKEFSSHLIKFAKSVAKKCGFTKIYFFNDLPLENPEFVFGLESFGNARNILYACDKSDTKSISNSQKELIDAAGISISTEKISNVKENFNFITEKFNTEKFEYPVKILVQDNYIEGLLYCAEHYRKIHGIK